MSSSKQEFPPLLPVGMHEMTLEGLRSLCVTPFPVSGTRGLIMSDVEELYSALLSNNLTVEVWVDGSFLTKKTDPNDSDIIVFIHSTVSDVATKEQTQVLLKVMQQGFSNNSRCDSFVLIEYSENHPKFSEGEWLRAYWIHQFGFSRSWDMKGIAVIRIPVS